MIYALSEPLQRAVYTRLTEDTALTALVGGAIYDAVPQLPPADAPDLHVTLGSERVRDWSCKTSDGAQHDFTVTVHAITEGFARAKLTAAAVCEALTATALTLTRGRVVDLRLIRAQAARGQADEPRAIALRFRAILEDTN